MIVKFMHLTWTMTWACQIKELSGIFNYGSVTVTNGFVLLPLYMDGSSRLFYLQILSVGKIRNIIGKVFSALFDLLSDKSPASNILLLTHSLLYWYRLLQNIGIHWKDEHDLLCFIVIQSLLFYITVELILQYYNS